MTDSLVNIFKAIANTDNEQTLHSQVIPQISMYVAAKHFRLFLLARLPRHASGWFKRA